MITTRDALALGVFLPMIWLLSASIPAHAQTVSPAIRVGVSTDDGARPLLYAVQSGLFKKVGLRVEIVKLANGAAIAAAVIGGSIEVGKGSTLTAVLAHVKGLPVVAIANNTTYSKEAPDTVMVVERDSSIKTPRDLPGKTIGVIGLQDFNTLVIQAWLTQNGVDPATVKFLEVPNAAATAAMDQGRIDATVLLEPVYSTVMASGKFRGIGSPSSALGSRFSEGVLFANTSWVAEHRDEIVRFNREVREAAAYVSSHEEETKPIIAQFAGYDAATLQNFHPPMRAQTLDPADLQPIIDAAAKFKFIQQTFPARDMICDCAISAAH
jgi:NitT/TauT family transport system substrate-binding protein